MVRAWTPSHTITCWFTFSVTFLAEVHEPLGSLKTRNESSGGVFSTPHTTTVVQSIAGRETSIRYEPLSSKEASTPLRRSHSLTFPKILILIILLAGRNAPPLPTPVQIPESARLAVAQSDCSIPYDLSAVVFFIFEV